MEAHVTRNLDFSPLAGAGAGGDLSGDRSESGRSLAIVARSDFGAAASRGANRRTAAAPRRIGVHRRAHAQPCADRPADAARYGPPDADADRSAQGNDASRRAHAIAHAVAADGGFARRLSTAGPLAETAIVGPDGTVIIPTPKKSHGLWIAMAVLTLAVAGLAAVVIDAEAERKACRQSCRAATVDQPAVVTPGGETGEPSRRPPTPMASTSSWCATRLTPAILPPRSICSTKRPANCRNSKRKRCKSGCARHSWDRSIRWCSGDRTAWRWCNWKMLPAASGSRTTTSRNSGRKFAAAWLDQAREELKNEEFCQSDRNRGQYAEAVSGRSRRAIVIARGDVRLGDNAAAVAAINEMGKAGPVPPEYQPLASRIDAVGHRRGEHAAGRSNENVGCVA